MTLTTPLENEIGADPNKSLDEQIVQCWRIIAPFWPLKSLVAINPLQGLEELPIEEALTQGAAFFQQDTIPQPLAAVNREMIKWLQAYFDEGQATIGMPLRQRGFFAACRELFPFDKRLHKNQKEKIALLQKIPNDPKEALCWALQHLSISGKERERFLTLLLTTLPGWASFVKYKTEWAEKSELSIQHAEYLAVRAVITLLLWPEAKTLVEWGNRALARAKQKKSPLLEIAKGEKEFRLPLLQKLCTQKVAEKKRVKAQLVFCIDVRSEPFRRSLESTGEYETLGFAGFFGVPVRVTDEATGESHPSCPVLLTPSHEVKEAPSCPQEKRAACAGHTKVTGAKTVYQSVKYNFTTPFSLVESIGFISGIWTLLRTFTPTRAAKIKKGVLALFAKPKSVTPAVDTIPFEERVVFAENALRLMGLTENFAPFVIFCGHGSTTQNNAYRSALDCGACGGHHGQSNARILAAILNERVVRDLLAKKGIAIPHETVFLGGAHNTTTDELTLFHPKAQEALAKDLEKARILNSASRALAMGEKRNNAQKRADDWAQVRPEWGLARNASFIVAPRSLTKDLDLEGRCFLHSYDHEKDEEGTALETILTAPMVVAQWINSQYLFSTLDNISYGGGSKVTKNITGKIGIMQGNASDLMTGLPLQSVFASDGTPYHEPQRLMTVVYAPRARCDAIIAKHDILQKLFGNGWVQLVSIEPNTHKAYSLQRDLSWEEER